MSKGENDISLHERFLHLNRQFFDSCLSSDILVSQSRYLKSKAGVCYFLEYSDGCIKPLEICLSSSYILKYSSEIDNVLLHEMIHLKLGHVKHNLKFKEELFRLNAVFGLNVTEKGLSLKHVYRCLNCGKAFNMVIPINPFLYVCNICHYYLEELEGES